MRQIDANSAVNAGAKAFDAEERYNFKLSEILRLRCLPFMLIVSRKGELEWSSYSEASSFFSTYEPFLDIALDEARRLLSVTPNTAPKEHIILENSEDLSALVMFEKKYYSIRMFPLHYVVDRQVGKYALVAEPIVKPLSDDIAFDHVKNELHLSKREMDVVRELMSGCTDKAIAKGMNVSVETVRAYLKSIRGKLRVGTRTAIVHKVHEMNSVLHREDVSSRAL